jgi:hypothetical protein
MKKKSPLDKGYWAIWYKDMGDWLRHGVGPKAPILAFESRRAAQLAARAYDMPCFSYARKNWHEVRKLA